MLIPPQFGGAKSTSHHWRGTNFPLSVAPMMDCTDRHYRQMMRLITRRTLLYTEMITVGAVLFGDRAHLLDFDPIEHPIAFQIGGSHPTQLAEAAKIIEDWGYDELNLNVGCPSSRVQNGQFGACLMAHPELVAECVEAMRSVVNIPVTVKHRIGIDGLEDFDDLVRFLATVSKTPCDRFTVHARIAILGGLSPKENRTIPPLRYHDVYQLKQEFPSLRIEINGGIKTCEQVKEHLAKVDAVMIGRGAYDNPYSFAPMDAEIFGETSSPLTRRQVVESMIPYAEMWCNHGHPLIRIVRHMLNLWKGCPGARQWRRILSQTTQHGSCSIEPLKEALRQIPTHAEEPNSPRDKEQMSSEN